ncbi:MAG: DUF3108 domain-containing protein [Acidobacteria bacterium]|nr:DUF3108 domain-containing protein [Acidobacteriota bacterium]
MLAFLRVRPAVVMVVGAVAFVCAQSSHQEPAVPPVAAPRAEVLHYHVEWRLIHAGNAKLSWSPSPAGHGAGWEATLLLQSVGLVSRLYKVDNRYTVALDGQLCARSSLMHAQEGGRRRETTVTYDRERGKASYLELDLVRDRIAGSREIDIPACVHDVIGGLYRLRGMPTELGKSLELPISDGKKSVQARIEAQQQEKVKTRAGSFQTVRYEAFLFNDVLYRRKGRMFVWLTDDERRLPVQVRIRLPFYIGTVTLELEKMERS